MFWFTLFSCSSPDGPSAQTQAAVDDDAVEEIDEEVDDPPSLGALTSPSQPGLFGARFTGPHVFEPVRTGSVNIQLDLAEGAQARVSVWDAAQEIAVIDDNVDESGMVSWDGRDDQGAWVPPGAYTLRADVQLDAFDVVIEHELIPVSIGVTAGVYGGEAVPLIWHRDGGAGMYYAPPAEMPAFSLILSDEPYAASRSGVPPLWDGLETAPPPGVAYTWPTAHPWNDGDETALTARFAVDAGDAEVEIVATIDGWQRQGDGQAASDGEATFIRRDPLGDGPGIIEETLVLRYMVDGEEIASQQIPNRMYVLLDAPTFDEEGLPYGPWVAAIDPALRAIEGVPPVQRDVLDALVAHIYNDLDLQYDTRSGASAYVMYSSWPSGNFWENARFDFTAFLDRENGDIINCTDASMILSSYANMLGADLSYQILNPSFRLNQIKAIGGADFSNCPFGPSSCGFSYHAITTMSGAGEWIYDATLALDGDDDPSTYPGEELLVQHISAEEYRQRLVLSGDPYYHSTSKGTLQ
ncbi:MAG: hypothetical protein AAFV53_10840 [Myxococcota bacterium]